MWKSDCLGCAVLLVVCLTLLASFFLPSHLSLKHVYNHVNNRGYMYMYVLYMYIRTTILTIMHDCAFIGNVTRYIHV